jgi:radical SAM protein with 4Fe4S-binding SPASM domain
MRRDTVERPLLGETVRIGARLLFQGRVALTFDQLPFHQHAVPFKKRLNFLIQGMQLMKRSVYRTGIPPILQIEPSNVCNLRCLTCATGAELMKRPAALMSFDMFRDVIDQVKDYVCLLVFWSWGEPFINKDAFRMIRYAKDSGLLVHTSTNGHYFHTREEARKVIDSGLDSLIVAVDGLDQPTYEKYRKGGSLHRVIGSIENLVAERASAGARHPMITLRFIVMKHNEHQIDRVMEFARGLGVDRLTFRSAVVRRSTLDLQNSLTPHSSEYQRASSGGPSSGVNQINRLKNYCHRPYANLTVFSNGDVVTCENDFNAVFPLGNIADQSIRSILSSGRSRAFLKTFRKDLDRFMFCRECENRYMKGHSANVQTFILNRDFCNHEKNH